MRILGRYRNGNYTVTLYRDGTKEKFTKEDEFKAEFPDSIDLKITDYCDLACPMCHEKSSLQGGHAPLDAAFLGTLRAGTELAVGGGNPLSHPRLTEFLTGLRKRGIVPNLTVNERHFLQNRQFVEELMERELIFGLGISLYRAEEETLSFASSHPSVVLHAICGLTDISGCYDRNLKILFLGYKRFGRGEAFYSEKIAENIAALDRNLEEICSRFRVVSFDNLALAQLRLKERMSEEEWERSFMGEDGEASMYIDLVTGTFARSSCSVERYPLESDVKSMFEKIRR